MTCKPASAYQVVVGDSSRRCEFIWLAVIILLGVIPRLCFIILFPTQPISDFRGLVDFAIAIRDSVFARGTWYWEFLNAGLPTILSVILRAFPDSPETTARWATAILTGLVPVFPYTIWRGVLSMRARILAGLFLALWPGQIFFSGVVAQDNWVLIPTIALSSLAVRSLVARDGGHPFWSAVLFALGTFIRQEMLFVLIPVALASAGLGAGDKRLKRHLFLWMAVALLLLLLIASQRAVATGRFALTTEHGGKSMLGAYVPGAGLNYWTDPSPYIASIDPTLLKDKERLQKESYRLTLKEALRRPKFHLIRIVSAVLNCFGQPDKSNLYWSLSGPNVLPSEYKQRGDLFMKRISTFLNTYMVVIHTLFLASLFYGVFRRNGPILVLSVTILLKVLIHAVIVAQPRYAMPVISLELLIIALSLDEAIKSKKIAQSVLITAGAAAIIFLLAIASLKARAYILTHDENIQRVSQFSLTDTVGKIWLTCVVERTRLNVLTELSARMESLHTNPHPGETASAKCLLTATETLVPLSLQTKDPHVPGGFPEGMIRRGVFDGQEIFRNDLAAQGGSGWFNVPLGLVGKGTQRNFLIEILSVYPGPGYPWTDTSKTEFRLALKEIK
jgi:hypothetical protein